MLFPSLLLFLGVTSAFPGIGGFMFGVSVDLYLKEMLMNECNILSAKNLEEEVIQFFSVKTNEDLQKFCPRILGFLDCLEDITKRIYGINIEHMAESAELHILGRFAVVYVNVRNLFVDLCTEESPINEAFLADAECFGRIVTDIDTIDSHFVTCLDIFDAAIEAAESFMENVCVKYAVKSACIATTIHDTCGRRAFVSYKTVVKTSDFFNLLCSAEDLQLLRTYVDKLYLEDDQKDLLRLALNFKERSAFPGIGDVDFVVFDDTAFEEMLKNKCNLLSEKNLKEEVIQFFSVRTNEDLQKICPRILGFVDCLEGITQRIYGINIEHMAESAELHILGRFAVVYVNVRNLFVDLCTEESPINEAFLADAECFERIVTDSDTIDPHFVTCLDIFDAAIEAAESFMENDCVKYAVTSACIATTIHDTCGRRAFVTYKTVVKRSGVFKLFCSAEDLQLFRTYVYNLYLEDDQKDLLRLALNLKERSAFPGIGGVGFGYLDFEEMFTNKCNSPIENYFEEIKKQIFSVRTNEDLQKFCPMVLGFFDYLENCLKKALGINIEDVAEWAEGSDIGRRQAFIANVRNLFVDLCTEESPMNEAFLADAQCLGTILTDMDTIVSHMYTCKDILDATIEAVERFVENSEEIEDKDEYRPDNDCVKYAFTSACIARMIHDTCGRRAFVTYQTVVKRTSVFKNIFCSAEDLHLLRTTYVDKMDLEDDQKNLLLLALNLKKRRK